MGPDLVLALLTTSFFTWNRRRRTLHLKNLCKSLGNTDKKSQSSLQETFRVGLRRSKNRAENGIDWDTHSNYAGYNETDALRKTLDLI